VSITQVQPSPEGVPGAVTDPAGIVGEELTFAGAQATQVNGYLARPAAAGSHPAMIVIHEAMGLNEHIRDVANRLANLGYVTLGVDLYTREGGPPPMDDREQLMRRLFAMTDETVLGDLEGAAASGQEVKVDVYANAGHAFFADYRPTYRPAAAAELWGEIVPFLSLHLQS
jgi:dienelactone hydrolase